MQTMYSWYGMGTQRVITGQSGQYGIGWGHVGATYGFQGMAGYFPGADFSIAVASNIETTNNVQPSDVMCFAYNAALGVVLGKDISCSFRPSEDYGGDCSCSPADGSGVLV